MSWDSFRKQVKRLANQTAEKVNRSADIATLQFKLNTAKGKLEDAYTALGKAAYAHFEAGKNAESEKISAAMESINQIRHEIAEIKAQIEELKKAPAEENGTNAEASSESANAPTQAKSNEKEPSKPLVDAAKQEKTIPLGDDFAMSTKIASESAESEGAISLKWD